MKQKTERKRYRLILIPVIAAMMLLGMCMTAWADLELYDVWVGGTQVTSANASNITEGQTVTASYDALNNILTLDGYDNNGQVGKKPAGIYTEKKDLIIKTIGFNTVSNSSNSRAIEVNGNLDFSGNGTLNAKGGNRTIYAYNVTVESGTINTSGGSYGIVAYPDTENEGVLTINEGVVNASGKKNRTPI